MNINDNKYKIALAEVDDILTFSDESFVSQIPQSFRNFIRENKDKNHITNINPYLPLEEQNLKAETNAILSLIYRSYIATEEEKQEFSKKDREEYEQIETEKAAKYNPNEIFKNVNTPKNIKNNIQEKHLTIIENKTIFQKIIFKIKNVFFNFFNKTDGIN